MVKGRKDRAKQFKARRLKRKILVSCLCAACICGVAFATPSLALINNTLNEVFHGVIRIATSNTELIYNNTKDKIKENPSGNFKLGEDLTIEFDELRNDVFQGTLDGGGHTINVKKPTGQKDLSQGLFGRIEGTIKNIDIKPVNPNDTYVLSNTSVSVLGKYLGKNGVLENVNNYLNLGTWGSNNFVAGLVEYMEGTIKNCVNYGNINSQSRASGIADYVLGDIINSGNEGTIYAQGNIAAGIAHTVIGSVKGSYNISSRIDGQAGAAGLVYKVEGGNVEDCYNGKNPYTGEVYANGNIVSGSYGYVAGVVYEVTSRIVNGQLIGGSVKNSYNYQNIGYNSGSVSGNAAAGIVFRLDGDVEGSYNYGNVGAQNRAAGIVVESEGRIIDSHNYGIVRASNEGAGGIAHTVTDGYIQGATNHGAVSSEKQAVGGIVGDMSGVIEDSINYGDITRGTWSSTEAVGGVAGIMRGYIYSSNNLGDVTMMAYAPAGGIAGIMYGQILAERPENNSGKVIVASGRIKSSGQAAGITAKLNDYQTADGVINGLVSGYSFDGTLDAPVKSNISL